MRRKELGMSALVLLFFNIMEGLYWQTEKAFLAENASFFYMIVFVAWIWIIYQYKAEKNHEGFRFKMLWGVNVLLLLVIIMRNSLMNGESLLSQKMAVILGVCLYGLWLALTAKLFIYRTLIWVSVACMIGIIPIDRIEIYNVVQRLAEQTEEFRFDSKELYDRYKYFYFHESTDSYAVLEQTDLEVMVEDLFSELEFRYSFSSESELESFISEHTMGVGETVPIFRDGMLFDDETWSVRYAPFTDDDDYVQEAQEQRCRTNCIWYIYSGIVVLIGAIYERISGKKKSSVV